MAIGNIPQGYNKKVEMTLLPQSLSISKLLQSLSFFLKDSKIADSLNCHICPKFFHATYALLAMKYCDKEENVGFIQFPDFCVTFVFDFKEQKFSK